MGARRTRAETKYVTGTGMDVDVQVSGGVSAGSVLQGFPGFPGPSGFQCDRTAWIVWGILGAALFVALGGHLALGRVRIN